MSRCELVSGELRAVLGGPQRAAGMRAFRRLPASGPGPGQPEALETLELALEGPSAPDALRQVEAVLARLQAGFPARLELDGTDGAPLSSPLSAGWSETLGQPGLPYRSRGLRLMLARAPYWEGPPAALALSNPLGESDAGLAVSWRADLPYSANWVRMSLPAGLSPLPAPLRLEWINDRPGALPLGLAWACAAGGQQLAANPHRLEGESGWPGANVTATQASSPACSGSAYRTLSWSAGGPQLLNAWSLTGQQQQSSAGMPLRLALRLAAPSAGDLWLSFRLASAGGATLTAGEPVLLPAGQTLALLPALTVPPGLSSGDYAARVELWGESSALPAVLALDCAYLLPCEAARCLLPRSSAGCPPGSTLVDEPLEGVFSLDAASGLREETHTAQGGSLPGWAGGQRALFLLWGQPGGASDVSQQVRLRVTVRPRRAEA